MDFEEVVESALDEAQDLPLELLSMLSGMMPDETGIFVERWSLTPASRRLLLLQALVELAESSFEMDFGFIFRHCMNDEDDEVRTTALQGLWEDESASLVEPLVAMLLEDPSARVREEAAASLGRFALLAELGDLGARHARLIKEALLAVVSEQEGVPQVRRRAIESIAFLSVEGLRQIIDESYASDDRLLRVSALLAMGRSADSFWEGIVITELSSEDAELRYHAARACGELATREAVPVLARLVEDRDRDVQMAAIWALGQIGGAAARRTLESCYDSEDERLQERAEEALAEIRLAEGALDVGVFESDQEQAPQGEGLGWDLES